MSSRAAAIRNRLLIAAALVAIAVALMGWSSDEGLLLLLAALLLVVAAVIHAVVGGVLVLATWLLRYRHTALGPRALGDIIGEHADDMARAGLAVQPPWRRSILPKILQSRRADLVPRLRHRPDGGDVVVTLEAVRAGLSQEELVAALPRLRSAWGVDRLSARPLPGGRRVEFRIHLDDDGPDDGTPGAAVSQESPAVREELRRHRPPSPRHPDDRPDRRDRDDGGRARAGRADDGRDDARPRPVRRPPDAPPVEIVQGGGALERSRALAVRDDLPPRIPPAGESSWAQLEPEPTTAPIPLGGGERDPRPGEGPRPGKSPAPTTFRRRPEPVLQREPESDVGRLTGSRGSTSSSGSRRRRDDNPPLPTDVDERSTRLSAIWRSGRD